VSHTDKVRERTRGGVVADGDVRIFRNGDWSGKAELQWCEGIDSKRVEIPGWVAAALTLTEASADGVFNELRAKCPLWADGQHCYVDHTDAVAASKRCACGATVRPR
jgi:hypothetical protein